MSHSLVWLKNESYLEFFHFWFQFSLVYAEGLIVVGNIVSIAIRWAPIFIFKFSNFFKTFIIIMVWFMGWANILIFCRHIFSILKQQINNWLFNFMKLKLTNRLYTYQFSITSIIVLIYVMMWQRTAFFHFRSKNIFKGSFVFKMIMSTLAIIILGIIISTFIIWFLIWLLFIVKL